MSRPARPLRRSARRDSSQRDEFHRVEMPCPAIKWDAPEYVAGAKSDSTGTGRWVACSPMSDTGPAPAALPATPPPVSKAKVFARRLSSTVLLWGVVLSALFSGIPF